MKFQFYVLDLEVKRTETLKAALEIRRHRHNFGVHIRQFAASVTVCLSIISFDLEKNINIMW